MPVAAGADVPLVRSDSLADSRVHGLDGLGGVRLEPAPHGPDPCGAVRLMADVLERSEQDVVIIALGPLTNLAALVAARPDVVDRISRIVLMGGGARVLGNMTPAAEFNIWYDPEAAARVFACGVPLTMVGLDVTHEAVTRPQDWEPLRGGGRISAALLPMVDFYTAYHLEVSGTPETIQHDSLAVAVAIRPELVGTSLLHVDVEYTGTLTRGMTVTDILGWGGGRPNTDVALTVDSDAFTRFFIGRLVELDARIGA